MRRQPNAPRTIPAIAILRPRSRPPPSAISLNAWRPRMIAGTPERQARKKHAAQHQARDRLTARDLASCDCEQVVELRRLGHGLLAAASRTRDPGTRVRFRCLEILATFAREENRHRMIDSTSSVRQSCG